MTMRRVFLISAAVHVGLLIALPVLPTLGNEQPLALEVYSVELVELPNEAPPVEEAAAEPETENEPEVTEPKEETREPEPEIPEEPVKRSRPAVVTPPPRPPEKSLEERIAERLKAQDKSRPADETKPQKQDRPPTQSTKITAGKVADYYLTMLQGKITRNWKQPSARFTGGDALTVRVSFRVLRTGEVSALNIVRSSNWSTVDQSALQAVRASAPFAPLPESYEDAHLDVTIDFTVTP